MFCKITYLQNVEFSLTHNEKPLLLGVYARYTFNTEEVFHEQAYGFETMPLGSCPSIYLR